MPFLVISKETHNLLLEIKYLAILKKQKFTNDKAIYKGLLLLKGEYKNGNRT